MSARCKVDDGPRVTTVPVTSILVKGTLRAFGEGDDEMMKRRREAHEHLPLTDLAFNILVALKDEELHGYGLLKRLRERTGRERLRTGTVYAALSRLQDDGLVEESLGSPDGEEGDERRRYYQVTEAGMALARLEAERLSEVLRIAAGKDLLRGSAG